MQYFGGLQRCDPREENIVYSHSVITWKNQFIVIAKMVQAFGN